MCLELLHGARAERVASADENIQSTFVLKVVGYLGQVGGLPNAVDAQENDDVDTPRVLGRHRRSQYVDRLLRCQQRLDGLFERLLHRLRNRGEPLRLFAHDRSSHRVRQLVRHFRGDVLAHEVALELVENGRQILLTKHGPAGNVLHAACERLEQTVHAASRLATVLAVGLSSVLSVVGPVIERFDVILIHEIVLAVTDEFGLHAIGFCRLLHVFVL
mmetsp:Transcript_22683/g.60466  ORF Transcript_22683/g.60466 Transcript_22683/m.60466 type:complete len:217 (+) Transcript_22683:606-1256(+)